MPGVLVLFIFVEGENWLKRFKSCPLWYPTGISKKLAWILLLSLNSQANSHSSVNLLRTLRPKSQWRQRLYVNLVYELLKSLSTGGSLNRINNHRDHHQNPITLLIANHIQNGMHTIYILLWGWLSAIVHNQQDFVRK